MKVEQNLLQPSFQEQKRRGKTHLINMHLNTNMRRRDQEPKRGLSSAVKGKF